MVNIIPVSHYLTDYNVPFLRVDNMGVEINVSHLEEAEIPIDEFLEIILKTDLRMMAITDIFNRDILWWRIWVANKVPDWDELYELFYSKK